VYQEALRIECNQEELSSTMGHSSGSQAATFLRRSEFKLCFAVQDAAVTRVEAGLNTSNVALRVRGDITGSPCSCGIWGLGPSRLGESRI
jgi:hypothetical protein